MSRDQLADWLHCLEGGMYDWVIDEIKKELAKPEQEPVCDKDPSLCGFVQCQLGKTCKNTPINTMPTKIFAPNLEQILNAAGFYRRDAVCCGDYEKCIEPCTPKGEWLAKKELAKEEPLPPVDIGVDVTPEGTHVVALYNRHDAVQEMFYSRFHPLDKPDQAQVNLHCQFCLNSFSVVPVAQREWVGLTGTETNHIFAANVGYPERMCRAIEAKLREKNCEN